MGLRKIGIVAAMWVLGLASLAGFAWAVQWLDDQPVHVPAAAGAPPAVAPDRPTAALTAGTARAAAAARHGLATGERSEATHALDAALRAAEVGHASAHGPVGNGFTAAVKHLKGARQDLHNGLPDAARGKLDRAVRELTEVVAPAGRQRPSAPPRAVWPDYRDATLLGPEGGMIGRIRSIEGGPGGAPVAVLEVGGSQDVLGFLDFGGRTVRVPADQVLWGPTRYIGNTMAALPARDPGRLPGATG
ncbi:hypothetical protein KBZ10_05535 [Streptomyces sp. F63]|uniref:hypothetical protein n=1 Tax=Streptomyces sp. F63 TaxID=2824887 RepID=UPI001B383C62|nr:hypothetical protein [Streptomyces sp. F63]MBQ0983993.1 hypothetical protein [Streptomyces sp. F63]